MDSVFIIGGLAIICSFIYRGMKDKREKEIEKLKYQKEILELEKEKQTNQIRLLELENKKLDAIIESGANNV
jgi:hypothetical protein